MAKFQKGHAGYWKGKRRPSISKKWEGNNYVSKDNPVTPLKEKIKVSKEYLKWRGDVLDRDNYTCQICKNSGLKLEAHHIVEFSKLFKWFCETYKKYSPFEDINKLARLAIAFAPFWDIDNGTTFCKECHTEYHRGLTSLNLNCMEN